MEKPNSLLDRLGIPTTPTTDQYTESGQTGVDVFAESVQEAHFNAAEVSEHARTNLNFLAGLAMPEIFKYFFPPVFLAVWSWLREYVHKTRDFSQLALGLPRGFGKTMVMKLFVAYCVYFTHKKFILILCENQTKANNLLSDVVDILNQPNMIAVFGDWKLGIETDRQDLKKFGFRGRNIILMAGTAEVIRGITLKNERPDIMIFDDIQSRADADSQTVSDTLYREMVGTAMKAKSPHGCLFLFVGNMYPTKYSILRKLKTNPNWIKFICGGITADGKSLWEELQPLEQLMREFQNDLDMGHPEIFYAEVLNDENASANHLIDISALPKFPFFDDDVPAGNFVIIDPATDKPGADATSIGYGEIHDTKPCLMEVLEGSMSPGDTIRNAITLALRHNCKLIAVESNAYQYSLLYWFEFIALQMGIQGIQFVEVLSGGYSKTSRILAMFKALKAAELYYHPRVANAVNFQISQFNPLKKDNVDGLLDLITYMPKVIDMYGEYVVSLNVISSQEYSAITVMDDNCVYH